MCHLSNNCQFGTHVTSRPWLSVKQPFVVRSEYRCNTDHPVEILDIDTRVADKIKIMQSIDPVWQQQRPGAGVDSLAVVQPGDVFSTFAKFIPNTPYNSCLGKVCTPSLL